MKYELLSPIKIVKPKSAVPVRAFEIGQVNVFTITESDIQIEAPINAFYSSTSSGPSSAFVPQLTQITEELAETYLRFQSLIAHCVSNGEDINNRLRELLLRIKELNSRKAEIMQMDFMKLRKTFSEFVKKHESIKKDENSSLEEIGALTALMHQYITDRNIYTHGVLRIKRPDEIFVIDYIEEKKLKVRAEVNKEILVSFLDASKLIRRRLHDLSRLLHN